jgi:hypothetical protein
VDAPLEEQAEFPHAGARARRWQRFERELDAWLASPDGRFATWQARAERTAARPDERARGPER